MNLNQMSIAELLAEKSYLEQQTGCNAEVLLLDVIDEINKRFEESEATGQQASIIPEGSEKHYKHTRSIGNYGSYIYTPVETEYHEITYNYTSETFVTVVFDNQLNTIKVVTSGKGSRSKTNELKQWGLNQFNESIN